MSLFLLQRMLPLLKFYFHLAALFIGFDTFALNLEFGEFDPLQGHKEVLHVTTDCANGSRILRSQSIQSRLLTSATRSGDNLSLLSVIPVISSSLSIPVNPLLPKRASNTSFSPNPPFPFCLTRFAFFLLLRGREIVRRLSYRHDYIPFPSISRLVQIISLNGSYLFETDLEGVYIVIECFHK